MACFVVDSDLGVWIDVVIGKEVVEKADDVELGDAVEESFWLNVVEVVGLFRRYIPFVCFVIDVELEVCVDVVIGKEVVEIAVDFELGEAVEESFWLNAVEIVGLFRRYTPFVSFVIDVELEVCVDVVIGKEVAGDVVELGEVVEEAIGLNVVEVVGLIVLDVNSLVWMEEDVDVTVFSGLELGCPITSKGTVTDVAKIPKTMDMPTPNRISFVLCRFKKYVSIIVIPCKNYFDQYNTFLRSFARIQVFLWNH